MGPVDSSALSLHPCRSFFHCRGGVTSWSSVAGEGAGSQGLKPDVDIAVFAARVNSCPDTNSEGRSCCPTQRPRPVAGDPGNSCPDTNAEGSCCDPALRKRRDGWCTRRDVERMPGAKARRNREFLFVRLKPHAPSGKSTIGFFGKARGETKNKNKNKRIVGFPTPR